MTFVVFGSAPRAKGTAVILYDFQAEVDGAFGRTIPDVDVPVDQVYFNPPRIMLSLSLTLLPTTNGLTPKFHTAITHTHVPLQTR